MRNNLSTDWAIRILPLDQVEVMRSDGQSQLVAGKDDPGTLFGRKHQMLLESFNAGDPILELPLPVIPLLWGHIGPVARGGGGEIRINARFGDQGIHRQQKTSLGRGVKLSTTRGRSRA